MFVCDLDYYSFICRSMLRFARRTKLGPDGLNWLKIHCINLTGLKKREPVSERLRYANSILSDILDSARDPLSVSVYCIPLGSLIDKTF